MALMDCPECKTVISDSVLRCLQCAYQLRKLKRNFDGKFCAWIFTAFNWLMFWFVIFIWIAHSEEAGGVANILNNGAQLQATFASTRWALEFWAFGSIVLGLLVWFNEPKEW